MENIWHFNKCNRPKIEDFKNICNSLLSELSDFLDVDLKAFKEHIVTGESSVISFYAIYKNIKLFSFQIEGVLYYSIGDNEPTIGAEILLFSMDDRLGLQKNSGDSYLMLKYKKEIGWDHGSWISDGWIADGCAEWENYKKPRTEQYSKYDEIIEKMY